MDAIPPAREAVLGRQRRLFRRLLRTVWDKSAFYREYYADHGIREEQLEELSPGDLPFVTKKILMENFDRAVTDTRLRKAAVERWLNDVRDPARLFQDEFIVMHGSGSSGTTGIFVYSRTDWNVMNGVMAARLPPPENSLAGRTRVAFYRMSHSHLASAVSAGRLAEQVFDVVIVSLLDPPERVIAQLERFQPHRLTGNSSGVALLADWALAGRLRIEPRRIFAIGDLMTPAAEARIRQAWRAPITNHYGASESLFLAIKEDEDEDMVIVDDLNILEILGDDDRPAGVGETGRVVVTNLYNYTLPILRYELGDHVVKGDVLASGFATIRSIQPGKAHDVLPIVLDDGRPGSLPAVAMTSFYAAGLERAQFVSIRPDQVRIDYVGSADADPEIRAEFSRILAMKEASRTMFEVRRVPFLAPDPRTGKVRLVVLEAVPPETPAATSIPAPPPVLARASAPSRAEIEGSIGARFERQVRRHAGRLAVKSGDRALTYDALNRAANRVAHTLLTRCGDRREPIGILLKPGIAAVTAILGVLKAGKFYVPLDSASPISRLAAIVGDTEPRLMLSDDAHLATAATLMEDHGQAVNIDALDPAVADADPRLTVAPDAYAYVLYTSGSTGQPKGVIQNHRNVLHQIGVHTRALSLGAQDRISLLHSHAFSASRLDIFGALLNGAGLCHFDVVSEGMARMAQWMSDEEITVLQWLPTGFRHFVGALTGPREFPRLRAIVLGSEPLLAGDVELHRRHFAAGCALLNRFGTTETGTIALQLVDESTRLESGTAPIGHPIDDTEILLLDESGNEAATGEAGEITVRSDYLSPGYWRRPELTRAAFESDLAGPGTLYRTGDRGYRLADGSLVHAGRKDSRTKVRGHRVEIGEIESALLTHPSVREAAVAVGGPETGGESLVAYMVARDGMRATGSALRAHLASRLPAQMVPSTFIWLDSLPLNPNGKLDRLALPGCIGTSADLGGELIGPRTPLENALALIWAQVLGVARVGVHDEFFDLGGHSLSAARILARVTRVFGFEVELRDFFDAPTVAGMAQIVSRERGQDVQEGLMSEDEHRRLLNEVGGG